MRNPFKACSCTSKHNVDAQPDDHDLNTRTASRTSKSMDNPNYKLPNNATSDVVNSSVADGLSRSKNDPVDDETVNRVLRDTRGQQGPVVQIKGDEQALYGGYGLSDPRASFSSRRSVDRERKSVEQQRKSIDRSRAVNNAIAPAARTTIRSVDNHQTSPSGQRRSVDDHLQENMLHSDIHNYRTGSVGDHGERDLNSQTYVVPTTDLAAAVTVPERKESQIMNRAHPLSSSANGNSIGGVHTLAQIPQSPQTEEPDIFASSSNKRHDQLKAETRGLRTQDTEYDGSVPRSTASSNYSLSNANEKSARPSVDHAVVVGKSSLGGKYASDHEASDVYKSSRLPDSEVPLTDTAVIHEHTANRVPRFAGAVDGVPVEDDTYVTKQQSTDPGWPLTSNTDPSDTKLYHGTRDVVTTGPLATELAERYAEPDKYSRHVHVHKEETDVKPAVTHEVVRTVVRHEITEEITRDIHEHDVRVHIQPILDSKKLPDRHWVRDDDGELVEITSEMVETLKQEDGYKEADRFVERTDFRGTRTMKNANTGAIVA